MTTNIITLPDPTAMATAAAARLIVTLIDAQAARGHAHAVLTGGTSGTAVLAALAHSPARDSLDWTAVDLWWGDERYLPAGHPDRNETQARTVLLDHLHQHCGLPPTRVHPMPTSTDSSDGVGESVDAAAARYAEELAAAAEKGSAAPIFDVLMLGVGPDGHIASLFPDHPGLTTTEGTAIAIRNSPKPPPTRISLTLPVLRTARQTWLLATGDAKADVVARAIHGEALPAGLVHGTERTLWLLDQAAASKLPTQPKHRLTPAR